MKLPPFGKRLDANSREIWVYFGTEAWNAARYRNKRKLPVLLLPPDRDPQNFRWPVAGKEVLLIQQGQHDILKIPSLANLFFAYGATVVRCVYGETQFRVVYYKRTADEVA